MKFEGLGGQCYTFRSTMVTRLFKYSRRTIMIHAGLLLSAGLSLLSAGEQPRIVPFPTPAAGPEIKKVGFEPLGVMNPGDLLKVSIDAEPGARISVRLGRIVNGVPCPESKSEKGHYRCEVLIPEKGTGTHRLLADAVDTEGRKSFLSSPLRVTVEKLNPWRKLNALNVRLAPVYFASGSSIISEAGKAATKSNAAIVNAHKSYLIDVEGHATADESAEPEKLSKMRADALADLLREFGVSAGRLKLSAQGSGSPLTSSRTEEEKALNRRAVLMMQPAKTSP
jgi:outer membrane protein OmpA-like peptidoglycan-associated protein